MIAFALLVVVSPPSGGVSKDLLDCLYFNPGVFLLLLFLFSPCLARVGRWWGVSERLCECSAAG